MAVGPLQPTGGPAEATWHHGAVPAFSSKALPLIPLWPMHFLTLSDDVEHLFMWVICISLGKCLFGSFAQLLIGLFAFLL